MKGNEAVNVLLSIVISLAVAHLLGGIGRVLTAPKARFSLVHSAWVVFLLLECITFWFSQTLARPVDWSYPLALNGFLQTAALYLSCWMALPAETPAQEINLGVFYDAHRRKFLAAIVAYNILGAIYIMQLPNLAAASWTTWVCAGAASAAWIWPARTVQILAVVVLLADQTYYELQFIWKF